MSDIIRNVFENLSAPISVWLNITSRCNLRCAYCSASELCFRSMKRQEMSDGEYLALVSRLLRAKTLRFIITGGEPLLRHDLVFSIIDAIGLQASVQLNTNATLIDSTIAGHLAEFRGTLRIVTSLDGPTESINSLTRGKDSFGRALRGVEMLLKYGMIPQIVCVLTSCNYRCLEQMVTLLKARGLNELVIQHFRPVGRGTVVQNDLELQVAERIAFNRSIRALSESEFTFRICDQDQNEWFCYEDRYRRWLSTGAVVSDAQKLLPCSAGVDQCCILPDGSVTPCNYMASYDCGNVRQTDFLDIWRYSPALRAMRALRTVPVTQIDQCSACKYRVFCRGGCRAMAYTDTGSLTGWDPICPHARKTGGQLAVERKSNIADCQWNSGDDVRTAAESAKVRAYKSREVVP